MSQDTSTVPRRYLHRQWKRNKPHLPPSDSLPALRLCPNRPLFVCAKCGFANPWIPLCLWCEWTSTEATKRFEADMPRPRRLSAPSRVVPTPTTIAHPRRRMSADSTASSAGPHTPRSERTMCWAHSNEGVPGITTVLEACRPDVHPRNPDPSVSHNVEREVTALTVLSSCFSSMITSENSKRVDRLVQPSRPTASLTPEPDTGERNSHDRDLERNSGRRRRGLAALCVYSPLARVRASCSPSPTVESTGPDKLTATRATNSTTSVLMERSGTPRSTGSIDVSDGGRVHSTPSVSSSRCSPVRGLRRTKNMSLLKRGSLASVRSRSPLRESIDICPTSPEARQSHDHDAPPVRLGHPSRPYYSAIRKDMSRPTSPVLSITAPRTPSPIPSHTDYGPRGTQSLDCGDRSNLQHTQELRPMSMVFSGQATSPVHGFGFSLSGEMELRMDLARWRRENAPDEPGGYHFRETGRSPSKVGMKRRVERLGRGLKALVLGKS